MTFSCGLPMMRRDWSLHILYSGRGRSHPIPTSIPASPTSLPLHVLLLSPGMLLSFPFPFYGSFPNEKSLPTWILPLIFLKNHQYLVSLLS